MASVRQVQVTFDCAEPVRVARFWCEVLGYVLATPEGFESWDDFDRSQLPEDQGSWCAGMDPSGLSPRLFFQRVPEPKCVKNRLHLDVRVATGLVGAERLATIEAECIRQIGIRSVDAGEKRLVHDVGLAIFDMRYIDEIGMKRVMEEALKGLDADTHLHVSFDVDFLDPDIAPGVGTTIPGGPNYREAQLCMEMIADTGRLGSLDIVELNPSLDNRNQTAKLCVDLVESLFGKSTLMRE